MLGLTDDQLLLLWEAGRWVSPTSRALLLHAAARPEVSERDRAGIPLAQRDAALFELHTALFGDEMQAIVECPACQAQWEFTVSARAVQGITAAASNVPCEWRSGEWLVQFRLPTSRDMAMLESCATVSQARAVLAERCVIAAERDGVAAGASALAAEQLSALAERMAECDPGGDLRIVLRCATCEHEWEAVLDAASFLWAEVSAYARRLLQAVHALARAFGWSERDILQMSAARRNLYLELVANE